MVLEVERKLAAILSADVVGYSRLMADDEAATIRTLTAYREQIGTLVQEHRGRVVDSPGDNLLAEFPTALDAVRAAVEIQRVITARNADLRAERRMEFRIGVHLGDISAEGERVYGDGVNIAARLEGLAQPGGVCISDTVYNQVEKKLSIELDDLGEQSLKNIARPVHVYGVKLLLETPEDRGKDKALPGMDELTVPGFRGAPAIAVLPFDNLSGDPEQEYFADGIAEDLITHLSTQGEFPVIARNSSFVYKGKAVDVKLVSRELGVRYIVEGSVRKAGDRIRVSAQLIDATTGHHIWAERYDRELRDIFDLQDEITEAIVLSMNPNLYRAETRRAIRRDAQDLDAYDSYLRSMWHFNKFTRDDNREAMRLLRKAVEFNPDFSHALSLQAMIQYFDIANQWTDSPAESVGEMVEAGKKALALDDGNPFAHLAVGAAYSLTAQPEKLIAACGRAIQLNPSLALAYGWTGVHLALLGRPNEAIENLEKALRLGPHNPEDWLFLYGMGMAHLGAGRYEEAADWALRSVQRRDWALAYRCLAASYAYLDRTEEAETALKEALRLQPGFSLANVSLLMSSADPAFVERYIGGLRKAGLRE
jgi:adenylate cyclase